MFRSIFGWLIGLAMFAVSTSPILAQQIQGQVRYADSGQPAFNALVECDGTSGNSQKLTDRDGKFSFGVWPGHYTVSVRVPGYRQEQQSVDLVQNQSEYMLFRLRSDPSSANKPRSNSPTLNANVPSEARKEFEQAEAALSNNKIDEEVRHLETAITLYPNFLEAELRLGTAYMDLQQWDKAEAALRKTIELDPKAANAYFALGQVYLLQKKYDDAEKSLQSGLAIEARSAQAHLTLARVYWDRVGGVKEEAKWRPSLEKSYQEVKQALELDPNLADAHFLKANLLFKVNRYADAQHEYEEYLRLDPKGRYAATAKILVDRIKKGLADSQKP